MQKRLHALLLTALMVWSLAVPAVGANPFFDVPEDHWAYDSVEYLAEAGLVEGYPDGTFSGSRNFTRYEMALVFARIVARFEQLVDTLIAEGIDSRLEALSAQVATAMKDASDALKAASEGRQVVDAEALEAAKQAQILAEQAMEVAIGTLEAIDARGWEEQISGAEGQISVAAARAQQALEAAEKAVSDASEAMEVAIGTLEAIDAQGWGAQIDGASAEAQQALAAAELALRSAESAMNAANEAMELAVGTLQVIDDRNYDGRIDNAAASADQALNMAQKASASAEEAIAIANAAMEVAVGTLEAIDARGWEAQLSDATAKADEALALARSIAALAESSGADSAEPTFTSAARAAIEEIAAAVVMDKLADVKANADAIASKVSGLEADLATAQALIRSEANRLEKAILDLTNEFATELEIVGVRVSALEAKFTALDARVATLETSVDQHGREIQEIRAEMDRYTLSGFNETKAIYGQSVGAGDFLNDPRNASSGKFTAPEPGATNRLFVRLDGKPNDEVDLVAVVDLMLDSRSTTSPSTSKVYAEATSQRPVRIIRLGSLDASRVAQGFSSQLLSASAFDKATTVGAFTHFVTATTDTDVFAAGTQDEKMVGGVSSNIDLGELDLRVAAVRLFDEANTRTGVSLATTGASENLAYNVNWISDVENEAKLYKASVEMDVQSATLTGTLQHIDKLWSDASARLPFAAEVKMQDASKADKVVDVNNDMFADQSIAKGRVDMPTGSFSAFAQAGKYTSSIDGDVVDTFSQFGVYDLNLLGFDTTVTRSYFVDGANRVLTDQRATFSTMLEDINLKLELNRAIDGQIDAADVNADRNQFMVSASKPVHIFVPWEGSVKFGINLSDAAVADPMHASYKLSLSNYKVRDDVTIGAEISGENNLISGGRWRLNNTWTGQDQSTRAIDAKWHLFDPVTVTAAYKMVNNSATGRTTTQDAGVEYVLDGAFGGDLTLGYGYRLVWKDSTVYGRARNMVSAAYTRTAGGFTLSANAKRYMGGTPDEKGNDVDTVASLKLVYPVFQGADLTVDGKYISSAGTKAGATEYQASSLTAGLKFNF